MGKSKKRLGDLGSVQELQSRWGEAVMRSNCVHSRVRRFALAAALISATAFLTPGASGEQKFDRLFVFGDSYTDIQLQGLWRVYPLPLQDGLGIPVMVEFGVGGARASPIGPPAVVPPGWHLHQQVNAYLATNDPFGSRDLITLNIGGNDGIGILSGVGGLIGYDVVPMTVANAPDFAGDTADYAFAEIDRLVKAGGQSFILGGFSGLSGLQIAPVQLNPAVADAYGRAYFEGMQTRLAPLAQSGARFFLLDLFRLGVQVEANLSAYGLTGILCPGGGAVCGGAINSPQQSQYYLGPDGLHLTNRGFEIVAQYMANVVLAPDTIAVQPDVVHSAAAAFTSSMLNRLDAMREQAIVSDFASSTGPSGMMGLGSAQGERARLPTSHAPNRVTAYAMGTIAGGDRSDSTNIVGFDNDVGAGTVGIEYRVNRNLIVGVAGNYTRSNADLGSGADIAVDAIQAAAYLTYSSKYWFGDALVSYGRHDLDLDRPGIIDWVRSSTDATSFTAAAKGGYLFDFGRLRAGPIAGLTYMRTEVDAYTEQGDPLLTFNASKQTLDTLTGNAGIQFRAPFLVGGRVISPYLNVMVEHQFGDQTRTLTAALTQASLLPILSPVSSFDTRTYGRVEGGVAFDVAPGVSATITGASTFARSDANDFLVSGGLNFRF